MADLNDLLNTPLDDIEDVLIPDGTWKMIAVSAKMTDERHSDKIGAFRQALFTLKPFEAQDDVDRDELATFLEADGPNEAIMWFNWGPIYRRGDFVRLKRMLAAAGVQTANRKPEECLEEINGDQIFYVEVERHNDEERGPSHRGQKMYAVIED